MNFAELTQEDEHLWIAAAALAPVSGRRGFPGGRRPAGIGRGIADPSATAKAFETLLSLARDARS
mgnify:CR=1 FL=1